MSKCGRRVARVWLCKVIDRQLPKLNVVGSSPISRFRWRLREPVAGCVLALERVYAAAPRAGSAVMGDPAESPGARLKTMRRARQIRISKGFRQRDLAGLLGVTDVSLARFETGVTCLQGPKLLLLAQILDAAEAELLEIVARPAVLPRIRTLPATGGPHRRRGQVAA